MDSISGIKITTDKSKLDIQSIYEYLTQSYWSKGISLEKVEKAISNSYCFGLFLKDEQIGFARVITDFISLAYLLDVFILEKYQNKGFGKILLESVFNDKNLNGIKKWMLATKDAQLLYKKYGFEIIDNSSNKYMIKENVFT